VTVVTVPRARITTGKISYWNPGEWLLLHSSALPELRGIKQLGVMGNLGRKVS
jgi:hypothetical protein